MTGTSAAPPTSNAGPIVAIGGSATSTEAVKTLISDLVPTNGMTYVLVVDLAAETSDEFLRELRGRTDLAVEFARPDGAVGANQIYVSPPGHALSVQGETFKLSPRPTPFRPIDLFLRDLAENQGHLAIAVILSDPFDDGLNGLRAVRAQGGLTIVRAAAGDRGRLDGIADRILDVGDIAPELARLAQNPLIAPGTSPIADEEMALTNLLAQLKRKTGVDFGSYKRATIARRLRRRMLLHRVKDLWEYQRVVIENANELHELHQDFLIGVTRFFRDPATYDELLRGPLPDLVRRGAAENRPFRFWVAGCSSGEEVYSIAMCILETRERFGIVRPVQIFASDTNDVALDRARAGFYDASIESDVSPGRLRKYFTKVSGGYRVNPGVRELIVFARHNVITDPPFSRLDGLSCRNLLIYLAPAFQRNVISMFAYALNVGGVLVLGASETPGSNESFTSVAGPRRIYRRRDGGARSSFPLVTSRERVPPATAPAPRSPVDPLSHRDRELSRILLDRYAPVGVLVNARMQILQFRGATGDYLEAAPGAASLNLLKMARPGLDAELRILLRRAEETGAPCRREGVGVTTGEVRREITLEVIPVRIVTDETLFLVSFDPHPPTGSPRTPPEPFDRDETVRGLERELSTVKHHLQSIIRDQDSSAAELQTANEEVLCSNEELQSINEELQTAKEELQSTNEELSTVNDELLHRNALLQHSTDDLNNVLANVDLAIVMVGHDLRLRRFTPAAERLFNLIAADVGRPLTQIRPNVDIPDLDQLVKRAIDEVRTIERPVTDSGGGTHLLRLRPSRTAENQIDGAVLILIRTEADVN